MDHGGSHEWNVLEDHVIVVEGGVNGWLGISFVGEEGMSFVSDLLDCRIDCCHCSDVFLVAGIETVSILDGFAGSEAIASDALRVEWSVPFGFSRLALSSTHRSYQIIIIDHGRGDSVRKDRGRGRLLLQL